LGRKVQIAVTLNYLGSVYRQSDNLDEALNYYMDALRVREDIGDQASVASSNSNLGLIYRDLKDSAKSIQFYNRALELYSNMNNEVEIATVLNNIGDVYFKFGDYVNSLFYFNNALQLRDENNDIRGIAISSLNIGQLYIAQKKYKKAKPSIEKALNLSFDINEGDLIKSACYESYLLNDALGNKSKALDYYILYSSQKDSILNRENTKRIAELQIQFEINKKESEINNLKKQKEIDNLKLKSHRLFILIILISFGLLLIIAIQLFRSLNRKKRTNRMLERLFSVVAHDLRSPVSTLSSLSDLLNQPITDLSENEHSTIIKHMNSITKSTISLLDNLLDWSKKQRGLIGYDPEQLIVYDVLEESLAWMDMIAKNKNITILNEIPKMAVVYADKSAISLIFRNLIINAIKFSHNNGQIRIFLQEEARETILGVEDKGLGMSAQKLESVLAGSNTISNTGTSNETGTGFGIKLCKEFITINKGKLWAESIENKKTIFYFSLPKESTN